MLHLKNELSTGVYDSELIHASKVQRFDMIYTKLDQRPFSCPVPLTNLLRLFGEISRAEILIPRQNERLDLRKPVQGILTEAQMITDDMLGRQTQPLRNTDVLVASRLQNLKVHQIRGTRVLEVVRVRYGYVAHIAGVEVEGLRCLGRYEDGQTALAGDYEVPFVGGCMPVEFAHGARLDREEGGGEVCGGWEGRGIQDLDAAAGNLVWRLLGEVIAVCSALWDHASWSRDIV